MKKRLSIGCLCLSLPFLLGSGTYVAHNADLVRIQGEGQPQVVTGTLIHQDLTDSQWTALFSRNEGSLKIEVSAPEGYYFVETWSIAADPMFPQRVHQGQEVYIGDGGGGPPQGPFNIMHLLELLQQWGPCATPCEYDFTGSGTVGIFDLLHVLAQWEQ